MPSLRTGLLQGIRVIDFTRVMSGPLCTAMLADLGAEVIKIEHPEGGDITRHVPPFVDSISAYFGFLNRDKKSVALDLKNPAARDLARQMIESADVVVENFRPGVMDRLGLGWADASRANGRLIYASISGFGQTGPFSDFAAYDLVVQAMSGLMNATGQADGPPTAVGESITDASAGVFAAWGIAVALFERGRTGKGRRVDVSMMESVLSMMATNLSNELNTETPLVRRGSRHAATSPVDQYRACNGSFVIVCFGDAEFRKLCVAIGNAALAGMPEFETNAARLANEPRLRSIIADWAVGRTVDEALGILRAADIPCAAVRSFRELVNSEYLAERKFVRVANLPSGGKLRFVPQPVRFGMDVAEGGAPTPATLSAIGADTGHCLANALGLAPGDIEVLKRLGAFGNVLFDTHALATTGRAERALPFELLRDGRDVALIAFGENVQIAQDVADDAASSGISVAVVCVGYAVPLPVGEIAQFCSQFPGRVFVLRARDAERCFSAEIVAAMVDANALPPRRIDAEAAILRADIHRIVGKI
jgi:CoA:oxalate CoA-transferase